MNRLQRYLKITSSFWSKIQLSDIAQKGAIEASKAYLKESLGELTGLPRKVNQILSLGSNGFEFETKTIPQILQLRDVEEILAQSWQRDPYEILTKIESTAHCASLSQVHRAIHKNKDELAIKIKYPNIEKAIEEDLQSLGWIAKPFLQSDSQFPLKGLTEALEENLLKELDFLQEMENLHEFRKMFFLNQQILLPSYTRPLCTPHVFLMSYLPSTSLNQAKLSLSRPNKENFQILYLKYFVQSVLENGYFHADPHSSNLGVNQDKLVVYDFGSMHRLTEMQIQGLRHLFASALGIKKSKLFDCFCALGFDPTLLSTLENKLAPFVHLLMEPLISEQAYNLNHWKCLERSKNLLGEDRWTFRQAAPADLFFLMKSFFGLFAFLRVMGPMIDCRDLLITLISPLQLKSLPSAGKESRNLDELAKFLKISVKENGRQKVLLTLKRQAMDEIETLIPQEALTELSRQNIKINDLKRNCAENGYQPQTVFELELKEGVKQVRVWLE